MKIEKEYKKLKESAKLAADASFKLSEQVYNLKAENDRLKQQLAEIGKSWDEISQMRKEKEDWMLRCAENDNDIEILVSENEKLQKIRDGLVESNFQIAQKYIKIRELVQEIKEKCNEARRTGRKAYLPIDILELITKAEEKWK